MRLWSLHPRYLDRIGLIALWREGLLAQKVLRCMTRGYRSHPQLYRFRSCSDQVRAIGCYLAEIAAEAERRGYRFDSSKIVRTERCSKMRLRRGQLAFEWDHLQAKLKVRDPVQYLKNVDRGRPRPHPLFTVVPGGLETWERA